MTAKHNEIPERSTYANHQPLMLGSGPKLEYPKYSSKKHLIATRQCVSLKTIRTFFRSMAFSPPQSRRFLKTVVPAAWSKELTSEAAAADSPWSWAESLALGARNQRPTEANAQPRSGTAWKHKISPSNHHGHAKYSKCQSNTTEMLDSEDKFLQNLANMQTSPAFENNQTTSFSVWPHTRQPI